MKAQKTSIPFTRESLASGSVEFLRKGGGPHADLMIYKADGDSWVIKDFSRRAWFVKIMLGRFYTFHENRILNQLKDIEGMPPEAFRLDAYAIGYKYVYGRNMRKIYEDTHKPQKDFFDRLERIVHQMHERNTVHLDLRNGENIVMTDDGTPLLLDFQSSLDLRYVPRCLHQILRRIDLSGIYKHWRRINPESMDKPRKDLLEQLDRKRRFWLFKNPALEPIHRVFNNATIRKVLLKLRAPLTIGLLVLLVMNINPAYFTAGLAISLTGEILQLWCFASLKKQKELADKGPYALMRNPMYIGRFFLILGGIMLTGNPWIIGGFSIIYYFYMVNRIKREEEILKPIFGDKYTEYCSRTNRFAPSPKNLDVQSLLFFKWELFIRNHAHWNLLAVILAWTVFYYFAFIMNP